MFFWKLRCQQLLVNVSKNDAILGRRYEHGSCNINEFFTKHLQFTGEKETAAFLQKHAKLKEVNRSLILNNIKYLNDNGISVAEIRKMPRILNVNSTTIRNRHDILTECGCSSVNIFYLTKFLRLSKNTETKLKEMKVIGSTENLQQRFANCLSVKMLPCNESDSLQAVRMHYLRLFFEQNGIMTASEFASKITKCHVARFRSFQWIKVVVRMLIDEFHIPESEIKEMLILLQADPENLRKFLAIQPIAGVDILTIIRQTPTLRSQRCESVQNTLAQLEESGIGDEAIRRCFRVLALESETVRSRMSELEARKEIGSMKFHPNTMQLVVNKEKVVSRLDHLNELNIKCFSINKLVGVEKYFRSFIETGHYRNLRKDCIRFLAKELKMGVDEVEMVISRHPNWLHISFVDIKETIETLTKNGFEVRDIAANIHIVLYSGKVVLERLKMLNASDEIGGHLVARLSNSMKLKMVLYQIEAEYKFNGDGTWLDRETCYKKSLSKEQSRRKP